MIDIKPEPIYCGECGKPVDESDPLDFAGRLACEPCIRKHYRKQYSEIEPFYEKNFERDFESFIQEELGFRRRSGARILRDILKYRAKERRKQERQWRY